MPNFIEIKGTFRGQTHTSMDGRTFETGCIRMTLSKSQPKHNHVLKCQNEYFVHAQRFVYFI